MIRAVAALALVVAAVACYTPVVAHQRFAMDDFKAFYCAGRVLLAHENPYDATPIASCEAMPAKPPLFVAQPGFVLPAPLPGYAVALFAALAWMPFEPAVVVWLLLSIVATIASVFLLSRLGVGDAWIVLVALAVILVAISLPVGELPPLALLGIALAAWGVQRQRPALLACGVALAMLEPQAGIAVAIAALALWNRSAIAAGVALGALAVISLLALGTHENIAYLRDVLPAHVRAELPAYFQYSLSWALAGLGVPAGVALLAGRLWWIAMLIVTFLFARTAYARAHPECAILAGPAFALVGGPFLHLDHVALAVPAALWLASRRGSVPNVAAVLSLALPLFQVFLATATLALLPFIAFWLGADYGRSLRNGLIATAGAIAVTFAVGEALLRTGFGFTRAIVPVQSAAIAQAPWTQFVASHYVMSTWAIWLMKAPIWFGLVATAAGLIAISRGAKDSTGEALGPSV